jgi:prepilin-type processing-associated H-X9-DG protein
MATVSPLIRFLWLVALGIAAALLFATRPRLESTAFGQRLDADTASCLSNLSEIARAYALYAQDFDGKLPRPYVASAQVFRCPSDVGWTTSRLSGSLGSAMTNIRPSSFARFGTSYYSLTEYGFAGNSVNDFEDVAEKLLMFDGDLWHSVAGRQGLNGLFADGHVRNLSLQQFERYMGR